MLDFGALPPEINSGRMYAGPGAGPMIAAATAWGVLAAELFSVASACELVVSELMQDWLGPAALSMANAAAPYVAWLHSAALVAEQTAVQGKSAVAAYESAFGMTVPPPVIAANRSLLVALVATNFFGQNTPAIAAVEVQYAEMWIQDAAAMYVYFASSVAASRLTPFTEPRRATDATGLAAQSSAVVHAISNVVAAPSVTTPQLSPVSAALPGLAAPTVAPDTLSASTLFITGFSATKVVNTVMSTTSSAVSGRGILIVNERLVYSGIGSEEEDGTPVPFAPASLTGTTGPPVSTVSAGVGRATLVGKLSVPASWATAAPQIQPTGLTLPTSSVVSAEVSADLPLASGSVFSQSVLGTLSRDGPDRPRPKSKPVIVRSPAAG